MENMSGKKPERRRRARIAREQRGVWLIIIRLTT
jgi:hypothetical protein